MKKLIFLSLIFLSCRGNSAQQEALAAVDYGQQIGVNASPLAIDGIQGKIGAAFSQAFIAKNDDALMELSSQLELLYKENGQSIIQYWRAYLQFYISIYHSQQGDKKRAEREIDKGIDWLKGLKAMNSEDNALLSMMQGYALQFKGMKVMFLAGEPKASAQRAIALDSANIRGYYVYASSDFYTPEKYGGGREAEQYLLKALSLPEQRVENRFLPSWGKQETYEMIIKLYIQREQWEKAKQHFQMAMEAYPGSYQISKLAVKLVGK